MNQKHWSKFELLHEVVQNKNIHIKGTHSYYSDCWDNGFERSVVRYLLGDEKTQHHQPQWQVDQLYIGDYVCIAAEAVILMGGNHNHRADWFCLYPFIDDVANSYQGKGNTVIGDGVWIGMRAMIMPGVSIGEGAVIAANSVVTKDVEPYCVVAGSPAKPVKYRFDRAIIDKLLQMDFYQWPQAQFDALRPYLCSSNVEQLEQAISDYNNKV